MSLESRDVGTLAAAAITNRSDPPSNDGLHRRNGRRGISRSSRMAVLCAKPGIRAATNVPSVGIATGTASTGPEGSESTADIFVRRQKVKNARGLRAKGLCGGLLGLPPAHEAPHRRLAAPRGGGRLCRDERDGGGPPAVRPPDDRGLARRSGRERDEPLPGPRPGRDDATHPDAAPATASNRAPGPRARVRRRLAP